MSKIINLPDNQEEVFLNSGAIVLIVDKKPVAAIKKIYSSNNTCFMGGFHIADWHMGNVGGQIRMFFKRHAAIIRGETTISQITREFLRRG